MNIHIADKPVLLRVLNRKKRPSAADHEVDLGSVLKEILTWANKLVLSEAGSILLDDPILKYDPNSNGQLYFAACFGKNSSSLVGTSISDRTGIAGEAYHKQKSLISKDVSKDRSFYPKIDKQTGYKTISIICAPIRIYNSTIGVIELINRKKSINYDKTDLALLEIFAGYTATLIHNALMARNFEEISKIDNLTGLHNDRYFFFSLEAGIAKAIATKGDISLIFFDLDHFKEVNDTHGHLAGSAVLKEVADILRDIFFNTNSVLSRYGGDEYVIIMPETGSKEAASYAEKIRTKIEDYTFLKTQVTKGSHSIRLKGLITCSIGVASLSENVSLKGISSKTSGALIKAADSAMYVAKESGKNRVVIAQGKTKVK